ncbi:MAG: hypothetical protein WC317_07145 [Candidatus Omnitrophota bacterium]|jgi:hypothetical protein
MKKILAVIFMLAATSALYAEGGKTDTFRYKCVDVKGEKLWESNITVTPVKGEKDNYLMAEEIKGRYHGSDGITSRTREMRYIKNKERLTPLSMDEKVFSESGKPIRESAHRFYPDKRTVECEVKDLLTGKVKKKTLKYDGDIINGMVMDDYIEMFLEAGQKKKTAYLLGDDTELYRVTLRVVAREEVTVNGKTREAYKITVDPEIGLFNPVKMFITRNYEWYSCEPPYEWLKFQGLESSLDSPIVEMTPIGE